MVYINYLSIYNTEFERHRIETIRSISECCSPCRVTALRYILSIILVHILIIQIGYYGYEYGYGYRYRYGYYFIILLLYYYIIINITLL